MNMNKNKNKNKNILSPLCHRRGTTLLAVLVFLPIAIGLYMLLLSRIEVAQAETQRHQFRTQARLLAESALARLQSEPSAKPLQGAIEGIGTYALSVSGQRVKATGTVKGRAARFVCEIEAEIPAAGSAPVSLRLLGMTSHVETIAEDLRSTTSTRSTSSTLSTRSTTNSEKKTVSKVPSRKMPPRFLGLN